MFTIEIEDGREAALKPGSLRIYIDSLKDCRHNF